jgi:DNA mismatch repair protein MutL
MRVRGLAGSPRTAQLKGDRMFFYVNGRAVNDRLMLRAAREAYKGRLLAREFPQLVLFLELDPEELDVNVHPAKSEVRFRDERAVFGAVLRAVESVLPGHADIPEHFFGSAGEEESAPSGQEQGSFFFPPLHGGNDKLPKDRPMGFWGEADRSVVPSGWSRPGAEGGRSEVAEPQARFSPSPAPPGSWPSAVGPDPLPGGLLYMGQVADTYLVALRGSELLLLDQHAVHERILLHRFQAEAKRGQAQFLALPLELRLHQAEAERLQEIWGDLVELGFSLTSPSASILEVRGIPPQLSTGEAREFLRDALAERGEGMTPLLNMMSCKAAIKAGQRLSRDEALGLLRQWLATPDKEFCPHGRPAVLVFGAAELERMFKRKA